MKSIIGLVGAIALLVMLSSAPLRAGNIVTNPGFETGDLTGWVFTAAASGTDFTVSSIDGAHSGSFEADFGGVSSGYYDTISQMLPTVAGQSYTFSFWLASDDPEDNGQQVFWDGNSILSLTNFAQGYVFYSFTEAASTSSTTIAFAGYNTPAWNGVDDVSVDGATSAPEPSSMILLGLGAVVFGAVRRRRTCQS